MYINYQFILFENGLNTDTPKILNYNYTVQLTGLLCVRLPRSHNPTLRHSATYCLERVHGR